MTLFGITIILLGFALLILVCTSVKEVIESDLFSRLEKIAWIMLFVLGIFLAVCIILLGIEVLVLK